MRTRDICASLVVESRDQKAYPINTTRPQVKRALEEGRVVKQNSCSQPTVEKALERVRQAILDPSVDVLLVRS